MIHRDLKPANVMLGKFGETLVVDWGLAKVVGRTDAFEDLAEQSLHPRGSGGSTSATAQGSTIGTPAFMSPEQAAGDPDQIGPASDVYGLGATLYYVLTGQAPFAGKTLKSILAKVERGEFPRLRQVRAAVPPALEAICLQAMALSPTDRYPTARGLIEDLERWIADEPVSAYKETRSERLARWMRRHRTGVQAAAAILVSVALISSAAMLVVTNAWRNEKAAREEAVDRWMTGAGHELGYYPGMQKTRLRLLEQAAADYEQFARTHSDDHDLELERGRTYVRLGICVCPSKTSPAPSRRTRQPSRYSPRLLSVSPTIRNVKSTWPTAGSTWGSWPWERTITRLLGGNTTRRSSSWNGCWSGFPTMCAPAGRWPPRCCRSHLAQTLHLLGELPQAEQQFRTAVEALNEIFASTSELLPLTRHRLAFVHQYYGNLLEALDKPEEALHEWTTAR